MQIVTLLSVLCARSAVHHPGGLFVGVLHSIPGHHRRLVQPAPGARGG